MTRKRKRFSKGVEITPENIEGAGGEDLTREGELGIDNDDNKLKARLDSATRSIVSEDQAQTLENKTIDGTAATGNNTVTADADDITYNNATSGLTATELQAAMDELDGIVDQDIQDLSDHLADTIDSHDASSISYVNTTSGLTATELQAAVDEVDGRIDTAESDITDNATNLSNHLSDAVDAHDASAISFDNTASSLAATDAQSAIDEVEARLDTAEGDITGKATLTATTDNRLLRSDEVAGTPSYVSEISTYPGTIATTHNIDDGDWAADTFTTTSAINLSRIDLELNNQSAIGTISVSIYENNATDPDDGTLMGISDPVDMTGVPGGFTTTSFIFSTPVTLDPATEYYYVVKGTATSGQTQLGFKSGSFTNQKRTLNFGSTWAANTTERGIFEVFSSISATSYAIQESGITVDDLDAITGVTDLEVADIKIDSTGLSSIAGNQIDYTTGTGNETVEAEQTITNSLRNGAGEGFSGPGSSQSGIIRAFTNDVSLSKVTMKGLHVIVNPASSDLFLDVYIAIANEPTTLIATSEVVDCSIIPVHPATIDADFTFTSPVTLNSGVQYAFILRKPTGTNNISIWSSSSPGSYQGLTFTTDGGTNWSYQTRDMGAIFYDLGVSSVAHKFSPGIAIAETVDNTSTGSDVILPVTTGDTRLTDASLTSIAGIENPSSDGFRVTLTNDTGNDITITNDGTVGAGESKIFTGTKKDLVLKDEASITLVFKDTLGFYVIGGTGADSGQGGINYILNPDAEAGTDGWTTYADAAGESPVDGTGGSPISTLIQNNTEFLRGENSFQFTKVTGNVQGEGFSTDFTIDLQDKFKMLEVSFDAKVRNLSSYIDGVIQVYILDIDNNVIIQPSQKDLILPLDNLSGNYKSFFQTTDSLNYRLIIHVASTDTNISVLLFDNFRVGPLSGSAGGAFISDWVDFTPTGTWTTNTTYNGKYRRVGSVAEIRYELDLDGAPNSATLELDAPAGLSVDANELLYNTDQASVGFGQALDSGSNRKDLRVQYRDPQDKFVVQAKVASATYSTLAGVTELVPQTFAAGDEITVTVSVPIVGWSTGVLPNEISEGKLHIAQVEADSAQNIPQATFTKLTNFGSIITNESTAWDSINQKYVVQETGFYQLTGQFRVGADADADLERTILAFYVNGSNAAANFSNGGFANGLSTGITFGSKLLKLNQGDEVEVYGWQDNTDGDTLTTAANREQFFEIYKLNNLSSQITPAETVAARYTSDSGQAINNNTVTDVIYEDKDYDSHDAMSALGVYTVPISGKYSLNAQVFYNQNLNVANASYFRLEIVVNGVLEVENYPIAGSTPNVSETLQISTTMNLTAGDDVKIRVFHNNGAARTLAVFGTDNFFDITKIGN